MNDDELIEALRRINPDRDTTGFNVMDFLHAIGSPLLAHFYGRLFWPEFVEIDDMIFLKETFEDADDLARLDEARRRYGGDRTEIEKSFNCVEIGALFGRRSGDTTAAQDCALAQKLAEMWTQRLRVLYPSRLFKVLAVKGTDDAASVLFYQYDDNT